MTSGRGESWKKYARDQEKNQLNFRPQKMTSLANHPSLPQRTETFYATICAVKRMEVKNKEKKIFLLSKLSASFHRLFYSHFNKMRKNSIIDV